MEPGKGIDGIGPSGAPRACAVPACVAVVACVAVLALAACQRDSGQAPKPAPPSAAKASAAPMTTWRTNTLA